MDFFHLILHWMGVLPRTPSSAYNFWSGFGSDIGEVALLGAVAGTYRKYNCHEPRCWRLGHHEIAGGKYKVCRKHHPDIPDKLTKGHIAEEHRKYEELNGNRSNLYN